MNGNARHWLDSELIEHLYGLTPDGVSVAHLESCAACGARWAELQASRAALVAEPKLDDDFLRAQRQAVWSKIESHQRYGWLSWRVPAAATALVVLFGLLLSRPSVPPVSPQDKVEAIVASELKAMQPPSDEKFYEEMTAMAASTEPAAASPVRALFSDGTD